jgi:hypothetical protein
MCIYQKHPTVTPDIINKPHPACWQVRAAIFSSIFAHTIAKPFLPWPRWGEDTKVHKLCGSAVSASLGRSAIQAGRDVQGS